jgi:N-acetylmuramoyl-L-alanine amidase CwlA
MAKTVTTGFITDTINGIKVNSSIKCNNDNLNNNASRNVGYVVMHYTGNSKDTAKANANYFSGAGRNASAHFFVDDSEIYQSVELRDTAWHCGAKTYYHNACRNANSIGIEMCCTAGNYKISDKTKKNAAYLCAFLCKTLGITAGGVDTYVLRHYDVTHKNCPAQMVDNAGEWTEFKNMVKSILGGSTTQTNTAAQASTVQTSGYRVKITADVLNVRKGPGTNYDITTTVKKGEVYTIVAETKNGSTTWGKLKSGAGYISLGYTKRV